MMISWNIEILGYSTITSLCSLLMNSSSSGGSTDVLLNRAVYGTPAMSSNRFITTLSFPPENRRQICFCPAMALISLIAL